MDQKLDRIILLLEQLDTRVDGCAVAIAEVRAEVKALRADMDTVKGGVSTIAEKLLPVPERPALGSGQMAPVPMAAKPPPR